MRGAPAPMGIVEHSPRQGHHIGLTLGDDRLGLLRRGDQPDRARHDAGLALYLLGELDIGISNQDRARVGADPARGDADEVNPHRLQRPTNSGCIVSTAPASAGGRPLWTQSWPVMRAANGMLRGIPPRTARAISRG